MAKIKANRVINDKMSASDVKELAQKISDLTEDNEHTGAVLALAEALKSKKHIIVLKAIDAIHDAEGSMPSPIGQYRTFVRKELMKFVKQKLGGEAYEEIDNAF